MLPNATPHRHYGLKQNGTTASREGKRLTCSGLVPTITKDVQDLDTVVIGNKLVQFLS